MKNWYEQKDTDKSIIISSRVRFARNLAKYPFPARISKEDAICAINEIKSSVLYEDSYLSSVLNFVDLQEKSREELMQLCECHVISLAMASKNSKRGLMYNNDNSIAIMLNEEDHLRIQSIYPGNDLEKAYIDASKIDDIMSESLEYAFDSEFGYLTSCPTNTGTGMRASFMLHLPVLENTGSLAAHLGLITKAGFAIRGTYGEGSQPLGSIYQISNQLTLGKTEEQTLAGLTHLVGQIVDKELQLRDRLIGEFALAAKDRVHRAYGILTNCITIKLEEAMKLLSELRAGYFMGLIDSKLKSDLSIYSLMTNIQPYNIQKISKKTDDEELINFYRAEYLRNKLI